MRLGRTRCSAPVEGDVIFGEKLVLLGICYQGRAFGERGTGIGQESRRRGGEGVHGGKRDGKQHGATEATENVSL